MRLTLNRPGFRRRINNPPQTPRTTNPTPHFVTPAKAGVHFDFDFGGIHWVIAARPRRDEYTAK